MKAANIKALHDFIANHEQEDQDEFIEVITLKCHLELLDYQLVLCEAELKRRGEPIE